MFVPHYALDDKYSYAFDGCRVLAFHKRGSIRYGKKWKRGDIVGCCVDLNKGTELNAFFAMQIT